MPHSLIYKLVTRLCRWLRQTEKRIDAWNEMLWLTHIFDESDLRCEPVNVVGPPLAVPRVTINGKFAVYDPDVQAFVAAGEQRG